MALECPNCREPVSFLRTIRTTAWGRFSCNACGSILGIDVRRRFLALIPWVAIILVLLTFVRVQDHGPFVLIGSFALAFFAVFRLCDSVALIERRAFRCEDCGYDLRGLTVPRCPECGRGFEPAEKERLLARTGAPVPRNKYRWVVVVMFLALSLGVIANWIAYRRVRAARTPLPIATPTASSPAPVQTQNPADEPE